MNRTDDNETSDFFCRCGQQHVNKIKEKKVYEFMICRSFICFTHNFSAKWVWRLINCLNFVVHILTRHSSTRQIFRKNSTACDEKTRRFRCCVISLSDFAIAKILPTNGLELK